jgi:hypothetical protein
MDRLDLVTKYLALRAEKRALAEEFRARMEPLCAEIKALETEIDHPMSCAPARRGRGGRQESYLTTVRKGS